MRFSPFYLVQAMAYDFFTVRALAAELESALAGETITSASTRASVLVLQCAGSGQALMAQCRRGGDLRLLKKGHKEGPTTGLGAEKYLVGAKVCAIAADANDRLIRLQLERSNRAGEISRGLLLFELLANKISCALISERTGEILGVWGDEKRMRVGELYQPPKGDARLVPGPPDTPQFLQQVELLEGNLVARCRQLWVGLDRQTWAELLDRAAFSADRPALRADLELVWQIASDLTREALIGKYYVYELNEQWHFSALEPRRLKRKYEVYSTLSEAIAIVEHNNRSRSQLHQREQRIVGLLRRAFKTAERRIEALYRDWEQAAEAEVLEKHGHVLFAHLDSVCAGVAQVELVDVFDATGASLCCIKLDNEKTPAENAAAMLKRAKKYARRQALLPARIKGAEVERDQIKNHLSAAEKGYGLEEIEVWLGEKGYIRTMEKSENKRADHVAQAHPRQYLTSDGWQVLAGRNNKENDILTHKIAAQNDVWFHAHGYPGSHVVLRREGRKDEPSKQALEEAAAIAAFWSKGKSAKKVPVVYTLAKYVNKPRGGAPGQAVIKREKTLMVEPRVPIDN